MLYLLFFIICEIQKIKIDNANISKSKFIIIFTDIQGLFIQFKRELLNDLLIKIPTLFIMSAKNLYLINCKIIIMLKMGSIAIIYFNSGKLFLESY